MTTDHGLKCAGYLAGAIIAVALYNIEVPMATSLGATSDVTQVVRLIITPSPLPTPSASPRPSPKPTPIPTPIPTPEATPAPTDKRKCEGTNQQIGQCMTAEWGWTGRQWDAFDFIARHESGWRTNASNGSCWGIPQSCPGKKMASHGGDWRTNPRVQVSWMRSYIKGRYTDPIAAKRHWDRHHWY